jgi:uncharacterized membrane protein YkoI
MKRLGPQILSIAALVAVALSAPSASADALGAIAPGFIEQVRESPQEIFRDGISLDEAVSRAEAQFNARVVRAEADERDGRVIYKLRLLSDDGRVFTVRVDAQSGAIY